MNQKKDNLIWLDLEFTGLDFTKNEILEISTVVTDKFLNIIEMGPSVVIGKKQEDFKNLDSWCQKNFLKTGLWESVLESKFTVEEAEQKTLEFIKKYTEKGKSPLCGNSIGQDRKVLTREMPNLEEYLHYRSIDVSTLKILSGLWAPNLPKYTKKKGHRATDDILNSIKELKYYREHFLKINDDMLN